MRKKLAALSVMLLAVFSTGAAFAFVDTEVDELTEEEARCGVRVYFVGKAVPKNDDPTTDARCPGKRVTLRAIVHNGRAKGTMTVDGDAYEMYARRDDKGVWHGVLAKDGERVGKFRGRYLGQRQVFIGGMKLDGRVYGLYLRRLSLTNAEPIPLDESAVSLVE